MKKLTLRDAMQAVAAKETIYARLLREPSGDIGFYRPRVDDAQGPHLRDEVYIVASGHGTFICGGERAPCQAGDAFFVARGVAHRFEEFSDDFATWVIFLGPAPASP
ncbi:MAG TPA: cupin domain-containing protein [Steroidobacteraceae bacterium]|nr:cupin domain-containing protein [Steroidobacteraceae bacterium]